MLVNARFITKCWDLLIFLPFSRCWQIVTKRNSVWEFLLAEFQVAQVPGFSHLINEGINTAQLIQRTAQAANLSHLSTHQQGRKWMLEWNAKVDVQLVNVLQSIKPPLGLSSPLGRNHLHLINLLQAHLFWDLINNKSCQIQSHSPRAVRSNRSFCNNGDILCWCSPA